MYQRNALLSACCLALAQWGIAPQASAVGYGLDFSVSEGAVAGTRAHAPFRADSVDFSYHACVEIGGPDDRRMREHGYFFLSSYQIGNDQNNGGVIDSQLNYYDDPVPPFIASNDNGYRIYGKYTYMAEEALAPQPTLSGWRLSYEVAPQNASISLVVDPRSDTVLRLDQNCQLIALNANDDRLLGTAAGGVPQGEKYETNGLANGDFKLVFEDWVFFDLPWGDDNPRLFTPLDDKEFNYLVFNGNITELGGGLREPHRPEGSGNLFWLDQFDPVWGD